MLMTERINVFGQEFWHNYSSIGNFIESDSGVRYGEAFDPIHSLRTYTETDVNIAEWEAQQEEEQEPEE